MKKLIFIPLLIFSLTLSAQFTKSGGTFLKTGNSFMTATSSETPTTLTTGIISYWKFDETGASDAAVDEVSAHNSTSGNATRNQTGKIGRCFLFATAKRINFDDHADWTTATNTSHSWSAWVNLTGDQAAFVNIAGSHVGPQFGLARVSSGHYKLSFYDGTSQIDGDDLTYAIDGSTWYHIVCIKSNTDITFYRNNVEVGTGTATHAIDPTYYAIGGDGADEYFTGYIDEFGYWGKALSADEVEELYNSGTGITYPFE